MVLALRPGFAGNVFREQGDVFRLEASPQGKWASWLRRLPDDAPAAHRCHACEKLGYLRVISDGTVIYPLEDALNALPRKAGVSTLSDVIADPEAPDQVRLRALADAAQRR